MIAVSKLKKSPDIDSELVENIYLSVSYTTLPWTVRSKEVKRKHIIT